ncbi:MAG: sigma 54-interacting transcriptional regulator [Polyangiaceae bacterium]
MSFDDSTATVIDRAPPGQPIAVVLRVLGPNATVVTPREIRLSHGVCVVGSGSGADLVIQDRTVSRRHVELRLVPEGVAVRDLGSRNGTFYLGQRIESMVLGAGGRLSLGGSVTLAVDADADALHGGLSYNLDEYRGLVGASSAMRGLFAVLKRLEGSLVTVLIEGESGVGKEGVAHALHQGSRVASGPFIAVNCGAIARELVASELFGHRRGAFTGAVESRRGAFEAANQGTLFLDEVGELPIEVQPMLLRALETGEIRAVGEDQPRVVKVRVVAATNRDLPARVAEGAFREDLFYRLAVVRLRVPPLRERPEDVDLLANLFARAEGLTDLPAHVIAELRTRAFPGNARELRNVVQAFAALGTLTRPPSSGRDVRRSTLDQMIDLDRPFLEQRDQLVDEFTRLYLEALLVRTGGNQTAAAQLAGLDRTYLGRLLAKLKR